MTMTADRNQSNGRLSRAAAVVAVAVAVARTVMEIEQPLVVERVLHFVVVVVAHIAEMLDMHASRMVLLE
jgi:hypothetical protein